MSSLRTQLDKEVRERETEAALMSAKLYEFEKREGDMFVEKRILTARIADMQSQIDGRDQVDKEIENCVCNMMEKMRYMEEVNKKLTSKIAMLEGTNAKNGADAAELEDEEQEEGSVHIENGGVVAR